jgi:pSer/pThr/pTyr-binding forkhead associated (FHA) protein
MEDVRTTSEGHPLQGPHRDGRSAAPAGFVPLRLVFEPADLHVEIHEPDVIVGRHSEAYVRLALPDISRRHCRLIFDNQQWRVYDLNSLNGVFVNGERMQEATLYHGDHLQIGTFDFLVEYAPAATAPSDHQVRAEVLQSIAEAMKGRKGA